jgi:hypothetical protein
VECWLEWLQVEQHMSNFQFLELQFQQVSWHGDWLHGLPTTKDTLW